MCGACFNFFSSMLCTWNRIFLTCPASSVYLFLPSIVPITPSSSAIHTYVLACMRQGRTVTVARKVTCSSSSAADRNFVLEASVDWHWKFTSLPGRSAPVCASAQTPGPSLDFRATAEPEFVSFPGFAEVIHSFLWYLVCVCYYFLVLRQRVFPVLPRARWCQSFPSPQVLFRILMNCIYVHIHSIYFKFRVKRRCVCRKKRTTAAAACWFIFRLSHCCAWPRCIFSSLAALLFPVYNVLLPWLPKYFPRESTVSTEFFFPKASSMLFFCGCVCTRWFSVKKKKVRCTCLLNVSF